MCIYRMLEIIYFKFCSKFQVLQISKFYMSASCCPDCKDKQKRYQIIKADLQFEIKRTNEDLAQEKVVLQMHFQRQQKKSIEKYQKEKQQRQDQNKDWIDKYNSMVIKYQTQILNNQQKFEMQIQNVKEQLRRDYEKNQFQKVSLLERQVQQLTKIHQEELNSIKEKQNQQVSLLKKQNEQIIKDLKASHSQKINEITLEHEEKVKKLRKEIDLRMEEIQNFTKQTQQKQIALFQQLYLRKQEIIILENKIEYLNKTITYCQEEIKQKKSQIYNLKEEHEKNIQNIKNQYCSEKTSIIQDFKHKTEQFLLKKLQDCINFEQNVKNMQFKRENQLKFYQTSIEEVKELVQERPSRNEDVQQIIVLRDLLNRKQKEIQKVNEQAKNYKLQLDYKEQTFNRIFRNNMKPLYIQKIGKKKEFKLPRGSALYRQNFRYKPIITMHSIHSPGYETTKDKLCQAKSSKMF